MRVFGSCAAAAPLAAIIFLVSNCAGPGRLNLEEPLAGDTSLKLARFRDDPDLCREAVAESHLIAVPVRDRDDGGACGYEDAVEITRSYVVYGQSAPTTCALAAALYVWERDVVNPAATRYFGVPVVRIDHFGTYACRHLKSNGRASEHAHANAIDVSGFLLATGQYVSVVNGWYGQPAEQSFLRAVSAGACQIFRGVLNPNSDADHYNHFHLDMGRYAFCG